MTAALFFGFVYTMAGLHTLIKELVFDRRTEHLAVSSLILLCGVILLTIVALHTSAA